MAAHGASVEKMFVKQVLTKFYPKTFYPQITHKEFKSPGGTELGGLITEQGQQFQILDVTGGALQVYSGADLSATVPTENAATLSIDQLRGVNEQILSLNLFRSQVKNPKSSIITQITNNLKQAVETYVLTFWADVAAGNWVGTNYVTGTVTVTTVTGAVVGVGTTFTVGMVGKPFRATGHSRWFRVRTFTSTTQITIEDDFDDEVTAYTGGAIAGAAYVIQADTALAVTGANIYDQIVNLGILLDQGDVPPEDRYIVFPFEAKRAIMSSSKTNPTLVPALDSNVSKGLVYRETISGFMIYFSRFVSGNNTTGFQVVAGHQGFIGSGFGLISDVEIIKPENNYGYKVKCLFGYGAKVSDGRRKHGALLFATFAA